MLHDTDCSASAHYGPSTNKHVCVTSDGSPAGGGASCSTGAQTVPNVVSALSLSSGGRHGLNRSTPFKGQRGGGDCASQAHWEAYTLWLACTRWYQVVAKCNSKVHLVGAAWGGFGDALQFRARATALKHSMGELALRMERAV